MPRTLLRNDQWERIENLLPGKASDSGVTAKDNRLFVEALLWILRTACPWRDLPVELGDWHASSHTRTIDTLIVNVILSSACLADSNSSAALLHAMKTLARNFLSMLNLATACVWLG